MSQPHRVHSGRTSHLVPAHPELVCRSCFMQEQEEARNRSLRLSEEKIQAKRGTFWKAFWFAGIAAALPAYVAFSSLLGTNELPQGTTPVDAFWSAIFFAYLIYATVFVLTMNNTFVNGMVAGIFDFGIVRMPGVIFSFSIDGFLFLIAMKIIFFFLGIAIAIGFGLLGLALAVPFSAIAFPFSLIGALTQSTPEMEKI